MPEWDGATKGVMGARKWNKKYKTAWRTKEELQDWVQKKHKNNPVLKVVYYEFRCQQVYVKSVYDCLQHH